MNEKEYRAAVAQHGHLRPIEHQQIQNEEIDTTERVASDNYYRAVVAKYGSPYLTTLQAAEYLKLQPRTLEKMRWRRGGPRFRKHGRFVRYHIPDLDDYSIGRVRHTSRRKEPRS